VAAVVVFIVVFVLSLIRAQRAFHPHGTVCNAEITALDGVVGSRLAGPARVRLSRSVGEENDASPGIFGMAIKVGDQDVAVATFESFIHVRAGSRNTNVADYLANQYSSVAPWRVPELGVIWFRAIPDPAAGADKAGTRVERLDADIAAGRAIFTLEARDGPGPDGALRSRLVAVRLTERLPDDPKFHISMFHTGRGIVPTGFRNGIRAIAYPVSQFARGLRGR